MYRRILVPMDGSEVAECVLPHVESIVTGCGAQEVLSVRAVEPWQMPPGDIILSEENVKGINAGHKADAESYLAGTVKRSQYAGAKAKTELLAGRAADSLADYIKKIEADLVIMATHGRSGISRWAFGSVADRILRSSCVPVFMVRAPGCVPGI